MNELLERLLEEHVPKLVLLERPCYDSGQLEAVSSGEKVTPLESSFPLKPILIRLNPRSSYKEKMDTLRKTFLDHRLDFNSYEISGRGLIVNRFLRKSLVDWVVIPYKIPDEQYRKALTLDKEQREGSSMSGRLIFDKTRVSGKFSYSKLKFF